MVWSCPASSQATACLRTGDMAVAGTVSAEIVGMEAFKAIIKQAEAGANIGLNLGEWAPDEIMAGTPLKFGARPATGLPARAAGGAIVPSVWRGFVGYSTKAHAQTFTFGILAFDGMRVRLISKEGESVVDTDGTAITARPIGSTKIAIDVCAEHVELVGQQVQRRSSKDAIPLIEEWRPALVPSPLPGGSPPWWSHLPFFHAGREMRQQMEWRPALLAMFDARGARLPNPPRTSAS
jgi:hypothetical protein